MEGSGFFFKEAKNISKFSLLTLLFFKSKSQTWTHNYHHFVRKNRSFYNMKIFFWYLWRHWCKRNSFLVRITTPFTLCVTKSTKFKYFVAHCASFDQTSNGWRLYWNSFPYSVRNLNFIFWPNFSGQNVIFRLGTLYPPLHFSKVFCVSTIIQEIEKKHLSLVSNSR